MSKHTPGPWVIQFGGMEGDEYFTICHLAIREHCGVVTEYTPVSSRPSKEIQANARLIAAAPDLLDVASEAGELSFACFLEMLAARLVHFHDEEEQSPDVVMLRRKAQEFEAAVAKATGEAAP